MLQQVQQHIYTFTATLLFAEVCQSVQQPLRVSLLYSSSSAVHGFYSLAKDDDNNNNNRGTKLLPVFFSCVHTWSFWKHYYIIIVSPCFAPCVSEMILLLRQQQQQQALVSM